MDIGGQALIRAACKNYKNVAVAFDEHSIIKLAEELDKNSGATTLGFRRTQARQAAKFIAQRAKLEAQYWERG
jgi:AICAR transformylase/IMP cyclohydrolase PurH